MSARSFVTNLNLNLNELQNAVIQVLATDPVGGALKEARFWYNSSTKQLKFHNGVSVVTLAAGDDLTTAVTMAIAAANAGVLIVSDAAGRGVKTYDSGEGILKSDTNGIISAATEGVDYITEGSVNTFTNKSFDANAVGNSISNLEVSDFAVSALADNLAAGTAQQLAVATVIKDYIDGRVASLGQLVGQFDASSGNLPTEGSGEAGAIVKGDYWRVSTAGDIVGLGHLEIGDALVASANDASDAADYFVLQANITDAVTSSVTSSVSNSIVRYDGTSGRVIKGSLVGIDNTGNINIPAGAVYQVNGQNIMTGVAKKYAAGFSAGSWVGASAPFTFSIPAIDHGLGSTQDIAVSVKDSDGNVVEAGINVSATGLVTLYSNAQIDGRVVLIG